MVMSPRAIAAAMMQETDEREVCLLTITHPSWTAPVRLSTDATTYIEQADDGSPVYGTISRGQTYYFVPVSAVVPDSHDEQPPAGRIAIDNVSRIVAPHLRQIDDQMPKVTVEVVLASTPDVVDQVWPEMDLMQSTIDASHVEVTLGMDIASNEAMPWLKFVAAYFPNLFG